MGSIGVILNLISSSMRTEELLQQLKKSNAELEAQAAELNEKAKLLELKNKEVELASRSLEEKDRKSTRLNSSHVKISYAVCCLKKKTKDWRPYNDSYDDV